MITKHFADYIHELSLHRPLSANQSYQLFNQILNQPFDAIITASALTALKMKGETAGELQGAIEAILSTQKPFPHRIELMQQHVVADCCGTGGDGQNTLNISTAVALIASTQNIKIAKHGNKAVSSACGTSDVLNALDIPLPMSPDEAHRQLIQHDITFMHAPYFYPQLQTIAQVRQKLKFRTIFNLIGPLLNPLQPNYQLIGVFAPQYTAEFAALLQKRNVKHALIVHGSGTDEIAIHNITIGHRVHHGEIIPFKISPDQVGLKTYRIEEIAGRDVQYNQQQLIYLLQGKGSDAYRAVTAMNAGALFHLTGKTDSIKSGVELAQSILSSDLGYQKVQQLRETSRDLSC